MIFLIFLLFGLLIGSFLNVVVYRLHTAEDLIADRSRCPHCKTVIAWYDNIPVLSFILLKFRCRHCKQKISFQYPLVEIFTGLVFAFIGHRFFIASDPTTWVTAIYYLGAVSFLIVIFVYDWLYMEIPGLVLWPAIGWTVAFSLFFDWSKVDLGNSALNLATYSGMLAAFAAFIFFFILVAISKEKWMGMGDAYLAILLGFILGWPNIILGLMLAFSIGAIVGIILIAARKKNMESQIPFAPFLVLGTMVAMFFSDQIINWYIGLFRL